MMNTTQTKPKQNKIDKAVKRFTYTHPYSAWLALFIGMPIFILIAVFVCTTIIILPISWVLGWV